MLAHVWWQGGADGGARDLGGVDRASSARGGHRVEESGQGFFSVCFFVFGSFVSGIFLFLFCETFFSHLTQCELVSRVEIISL